jgi:hypothetical protein
MKNTKKRSACLVAAGVVAVIGLVACGIIAFQIFDWDLDFLRPSAPIQTTAYIESFDSTESWMAGEGTNAAGLIKDGVYEMTLAEETFDEQFWAAGGRNFANAVFEVEATALGGVIDNGYGMMIRVDPTEDRFYIFKVSSDGYVYIGLCTENCSSQQALVDRDWFESHAVKQGFDSANVLRIVADGPEMTFFVNDIEVGRVSDITLENGDIGIFGETFAPGGLRVAFDNFNVTPLEEE